MRLNKRGKLFIWRAVEIVAGVGIPFALAASYAVADTSRDLVMALLWAALGFLTVAQMAFRQSELDMTINRLGWRAARCLSDDIEEMSIVVTREDDA